MPSERAAQWFRDIITACALIEMWTKEAGGPQMVMTDEKLRSAVERQLLVMSEAAIRLQNIDGDITSKLAPEIDWAGVRGMGNVIRHRYDDMDFEIVADVLATKLGALRFACERALQAI
jgi:uncharacterized protein with HEPN domain